MRWFRTAMGVVVVAGWLVVPGSASAQPKADDRESAAQQFADGQRAFKAGDFRAAARAFEAANRAAPHHDVLWNAARAWHAPARSPAPRTSTPSISMSRRATASTARARPRRSRRSRRSSGSSRSTAPTTTSSRSTTRRRPRPRVYVAPGAHAVRIRTAKDTRTRVVSATAGAVVSVTTSTETEDAPPPERPPRARPLRRLRRLTLRSVSPAFVWIGGGLGVVATGLTVWAGVATLSSRSDFDAVSSQANLDHGRHLQTLTNVGIVVSTVIGLATLGTALFLVDWRRR